MGIIFSKNISGATMVKSSKTFWRKLCFRTTETAQLSKQWATWYTTVSRQSHNRMRKEPSTSLRFPGHCYFKTWSHKHKQMKKSISDKPHGLWFMILFLIPHINLHYMLQYLIAFFLLVFVHTHEKCICYIYSCIYPIKRVFNHDYLFLKSFITSVTPF